MPGEGAIDMVVLAVHVGGNCSSDGYLTRAGGDRDPPAMGRRRSHQGVEGRASTDEDRAGRDIEIETVQFGHVEHESSGVLGGVAVRTPESSGDDSTVTRAEQQWRYGCCVSHVIDRCSTGRGQAPSGEQLHI